MFRKLPGFLAYLLMLFATLFASFWGTSEFFHEGWFHPYTQVVYYAAPAVVLAILTLISIRHCLAGGLTILIAALLFSGWRVWSLAERHIAAQGSVWLTGILMALPGFLFLWDAFLQHRLETGNPAWAKARIGWKETFAVGLPCLCALVLGVPQLIHNVQRLPLEHYDQAVVEGNGLRLVFAGRGPGWSYSNRDPLVFKGKTYSGLSWNEIALFGKAPIGVEGKRHGLSYNGTAQSVTQATQDEYDRYNMFRYINREGTELTTTIQDCWRLPGVQEYVRIFLSRGRNAGGLFNPANGSATYVRKPDKEAPLWAPDREVIYYWTSTSLDRERAYDVTYTGMVRPMSKNTSQDYRGYRAVRTGLESIHSGPPGSTGHGPRARAIGLLPGPR
ncbi:MAG: hypothetical protein HYU64_10065 [Armatimonadetes bacterium]|nr:hypothetical protein [Armatimonadota bacterium]